MENYTCTPHRANTRFHIFFEDFALINDDDPICANALRVFEVRTNRRIASLRDRYSIPDTVLPHEDDLWLETSLRDLEWWSLSARRKSAYARALAEPNGNEKYPSLIERGFIRSRLVARPGECHLVADDGTPVKPVRPKRKIQRDEQGAFIVVDAPDGAYEVEGQWYNARASGFSRIVKQYLYDIEAVRTALAALDDDPPPKPAPRWKPLCSGGGGSDAAVINGEESTLVETTTCHHENASPSPSNELSYGGARRGTSSHLRGASFENQNITDDRLSSTIGAHNGTDSRTTTGCVPGVQRWTGVSNNGWGRPAMGEAVQGRKRASSNGDNKKEKDQKESRNILKKDSAPPGARFSLLSSFLSEQDYADLRAAPWCPEVVMALVSRVLPVPDFEEIRASGDAAAIEEFYEQWLKPAERLIHRTAHEVPAIAWKEIDCVTRYMTQAGSPSWWRPGPVGKHRSEDTPIFLRHVADNFATQRDDLRKNQWQPAEATPYDGPSDSWFSPPPHPESTAHPWTHADAPEPHTDELPTVAVPQRASPVQPGLGRIAANRLAAEIAADHPAIILSRVQLAPSRFAVGMATGEDQWLDFESLGDYYDSDPETAALIEQAVRYGESQAGGDAPGHVMMA